MGRTVTFSFSSARYEGAKATETFTFEKLGLEASLGKRIRRNLSCLGLGSSIVTAKEKDKL